MKTKVALGILLLVAWLGVIYLTGEEDVVVLPELETIEPPAPAPGIEEEVVVLGPISH